MRGTSIHVRPWALAANLAVARRAAKGAELVAMVKANGYGHGLQVAATALQQADRLGVAVVDEASQLRQSGIPTPLLVVEGVFDADELTKAMALGDVACVFHSVAQIDLLVAFLEKHSSWSQTLDIWLKLDSGMHRLGMDAAVLQQQYRRLMAWSNIRVTTLITHLACADQENDPASREQIRQARELAAKLGVKVSIANSAALLRYDDALVDAVRPGIMLYGGSPLNATTAASLGLTPTMTLTAKLLAINAVAAGEYVGYGRRWQAARPSRIGVASVGYGDGYPRAAVDGTPVAVKTAAGVFIAPLAGRVSMDMITLDVTDIPTAKIGDEVELWGDYVAVDEVARYCHTISYELFCQLGSRPQRYVDVSEPQHNSAIAGRCADGEG